MRVRVPVFSLMVGFLCPLSGVLGQGMIGPGGGGFGGGGLGNTPQPNVFQWQQKLSSPLVVFKKPEGDPPEWMQMASVESKAHDEISAILKQKMEADFPGVPLVQVMQGLADDLNIPIWINTSELDLLGIDPDVPITLNLPPVALRSALRLMLEPMELTYIIRNEVLEITSIDSAEADPITAYYDMSWVIDSSDQAASLLNAVQMNIDPDSWLLNGGTSVVTCVGQTMIISAPTTTQEKVRAMLGKLGGIRAKNSPALKENEKRAVKSSVPKVRS